MKCMFPITSKKTIKSIFKHLRKFDNSGIIDRNYMIGKIAVNLGLRISDVIELKENNFLSDFLVIKEKKLRRKVVRKKRIIQLNKRLKKEIQEYIKINNIKGYLFTAKDSKKPLTRQQAWNIMKGIEKEFGLYNFGTHSFKKTFADLFLKNGGDLKTLQFYFNHENEIDTLRYAGIFQIRMNEFFNKFYI